MPPRNDGLYRLLSLKLTYMRLCGNDIENGNTNPFEAISDTSRIITNTI